MLAFFDSDICEDLEFFVVFIDGGEYFLRVSVELFDVGARVYIVE